MSESPDFDAICDPAEKTHLIIWKSIKGTWFAKIWEENYQREIPNCYTAEAPSPQMAVDTVIDYYYQDRI